MMQKGPLLQESEWLVADKDLHSKVKVQPSVHKGSLGTLRNDTMVSERTHRSAGPEQNVSRSPF